MGKLIKATANLYSDSNFSNLVGSIRDVSLGIGTGGTNTVDFKNIGNLYTFFVDNMYGEDWVFLGGTYYYQSGVTIASNKEPHLWFPLCAEISTELWQNSYYLEYVFSNGYYCRRTGRLIDGATTGWNFYDDKNALIGYVNNLFGFYCPNTTGDGRTRYTCLVVSSLDSDGNIPADATGAIYSLNGQYGSDMWGSIDKLTAARFNVIRDFFNGIPGYIREPDPYGSGGGTSETGGGTGTFDGTSDNVDFPSLPTLSAVSTGFITLFNPSISQLKSLANYMWSGAFDLNTFRKLFANPMDCILGLSIVPVAVPNGGTYEVTVGNIPTGISMTKAEKQYVEVDCGTLNVEEYWGAYLDYDPYTKAELYLPYIGIHAISVDDIMNKPVHIKYHVDILSGACTAYVKCGSSVLYTFIGQCSSSIPVTGNDWTSVINGVLSIAGAVGSMVATGGASAPMAADIIASTAVNGMKPTVEKSGSMSGTGGMLAIQTPYLILTRPRQAVPSGQNQFMGYPSFITENLGDISGYTEIESIHLENIPATEQELSEIESLLKEGVIL